MAGKNSLACPYCGYDPNDEGGTNATENASPESEKVSAAHNSDSNPSATSGTRSQATESDTSSTETQGNENASSPFELEESEMKQATKSVVKEVMKVLNPLLEKLNEANEQLKQQQPQMPSAMNMSQDGLASNLEKLQKVSEERMKNQELKVAARMQKMQNRLG